MATVYYPNGHIEEGIEPKNLENGFTLNELYKLIGCEAIETWQQPNGSWLVFDEMPERSIETANEIATSVAGFLLFGIVVECDLNEFQ